MSGVFIPDKRKPEKPTLREKIFSSPKKNIIPEVNTPQQPRYHFPAQPYVHRKVATPRQ